MHSTRFWTHSFLSLILEYVGFKYFLTSRDVYIYIYIYKEEDCL